jgi:Transcriptional regulatory protein, C terminal
VLNRLSDDGDVTTLQTVELGVLGPLQVRQYGLSVSIPGAKPRAILTMLGLHGGGVVSADTLVELLWGDDPPRTAAKALQTHISSLRRTLGDGFVLTEGTGWVLNTTEVDATRYKLAARLGRDAVAAGDTSQAVARFDEALASGAAPPNCPTASAAYPRRHAGSRAMPPWSRTGPMHCLRRAAQRRSSASSRPRCPTRPFAKGVGVS